MYAAKTIRVDDLKKFLYLVSMYCGSRAMFNRIHSYFLPKPRAAIIDGQLLQFDGLDCARVCVHARATSTPDGAGQIAGMISVYSVKPGIPRLVYAALRLTSHFGCGHVEIAFTEQQEIVTFFAIRNILRSNLDRLGCRKLFCGLKFSSENDEILVLRKIDQLLKAQGISTAFASPEDCVSLAVDDTLLKPETRSRTIRAIKRRYRRIVEKSAVHPMPERHTKSNG